MASKKKRKGMVLQQEGATTPAMAPAADHPPACFVLPKPGKASEGGMEQSICGTKEEADMMDKPNMYPSKEPTRTSDALPVVKRPTTSNPQSDNLSPYSICKGIKVTLDNNGMWNEFFRCRTEMILTKQGSRMFPYCRFRISGLQPSKNYSLYMDIQPLDNSCYKWTGKSWQVSGKAEHHVKSQPFIHPESPSTGQHWMQNPVSFYKLRLTNSISEPEGNTVLHPMHRYLPRLHVVQTDKAAKDVRLNGANDVTFTFLQTEFLAVTSYQNSRFAQLKVDYNPFAKGLKEEGSGSSGPKMKLNSGKDEHKAGGAKTNEQHPVKRSLKSLLANHKPRSSKAVDAKPPGSGDLQKNSTMTEDPSAANVTGESSCSSSRPPPKLFSELIREAHVSLHRCNLEQLGMRTELTSTKTTALRSSGPDVPKRSRVSVKTLSETSPGKKEETVDTKRKVKDKDLLNSSDSVRTDGPVESQSSSLVLDHQRTSEAPSEVKVKPTKRPLPLPALALFLKQHSTKSKMAKTKQDSPPPAPPLDLLSGSQSRAPACLPSDHTSKATRPLKESSSQASGQTEAQPDEIFLNVTGQAAEMFSPSLDATNPKGLRTDDVLACVPLAESTCPELPRPDGTPVFPYSNQPFCTLGPSVSTISSSPILSPSLESVLPALSSPTNKPPVTECSAPASDSPAVKSDSLLSDPECSSFGFEPLSPASSPEPLPSLPVSLALELDSTVSESVPKPESPQELLHGEDSVFKWHTVLPPPEPCIDPSFTTFQPTPQSELSESVTSPLLSSQTPSDPGPQTHDTDPNPSSTPPPDPSFQEQEAALPFPAELSPLALQMPLSPTFSSLDGDGLSPTPSIADLVHFFSTNDDLGMGVEFSNTEPVVSCPPPPTVEANPPPEPPHLVEPLPANKPRKYKKKRKLMDVDVKMEASNYTKMQPNLEEVEEQLFISFTSKEALQSHIADSSDGLVSQPQITPEGHLQQSFDTPENAETEEEMVAAFEKLLLRDLKLMRHGQVIHPVLQQVGLKMNLLDPSLAIDLQYLGVHLPIPPPGVSLDLPQSPGVSAAFVSRTGKTTDVTQIKGWRDKFSPLETPSTLTAARPEAGPSSDLKRNLSAFCSDMLDEYLETEGKLMDQRASSFSQPLEPLVYQLPTRSSSYVRTLDSVLKKQTAGGPTSDLISGFIPPSKRPKLALRETKLSRRQRPPKHSKARVEPEPSPAESNVVPKNPPVQVPGRGPGPAPATEPQKSRKQLKVRFHLPESQSVSPPKRRNKLKSRTSSQTLSPPMTPKDSTPLESDTEFGPVGTQKDGGPVMTRALLRQKDLEDGVVWEGRPRTSITEDRAAIALTSLFTLKGFVRENPTAPIQLIRRRAPPCLSESCRLGCVCSSLAHCSRISHCGRPQCMLGCSCLKQKVVLLKNLDGSDSSPSQPGDRKRRRRRRRMKMAYVLKEADSVSQPAERVRTLWKQGNVDPDPVHIPEPAPLLRSTERAKSSSCARVRVYLERKKKSRTQTRRDPDFPDPPEKLKDVKTKVKPLKQKDPKSRPCSPSPAADRALSPPTEPKPSKRLVIVAECKWVSDGDRNLVLKTLCEAMAQDRLGEPFWIKDYLISPLSPRMEVNADGHCIHYKVHISRPRLERERPEKPLRKTRETREQQEHLKQVIREPEPPEDWQRQVEEEEEVEPPEDWQRQVEEEEEVEPPEDWQRQVEEEEEVEPPEDWQRQVEEGDIEEEAGSAGDQVHKEMKPVKRKVRANMALPFLTGVSPAGFLSANKKKPGETDHLVQVNGKLYPLAKIQLGKMGALHPANRLAAYLTGRVGSSRKSSPPNHKPSVSSASSVVPTPLPRPQPSVAVPPIPTPSTAVKVNQSGATRVVTVMVYPGAKGGASQVRALPAVSAGSAPSSDSQVSSAVAKPVNLDPKGSQVLMVQVPQPPGPPGHPPGCPPGPPGLPLGPPPSLSTSQRMVLQPVQMASGVQYYRRPDGKLVQLVPINQLRPISQNQPVQRVLPAAPPQTPVGKQIPPPTTVTTSSSTSSLSGLQSFSMSSFPSPLRFTSSFLAQKGVCTFKILPPSSSREPLVITSPNGVSKMASPGSFTLLQPQSSSSHMNLISLKPSTGQGAELGVKTMAVSAAPVAPGVVSVHQKPEVQTATGTGLPPLPAAPPGSKATPAPPGEPAYNLTDLDIISVDDEAGLVTTEMMDRDGWSSETENSSDFGDESGTEEEKGTANINNHRHNMLEKQRRMKLRQLFEGLRKETGLSDDKTSKISTLKMAVQVIQELRTTEKDLERKKRRMTKRRDDYLAFITPTTESCQVMCHRSPEPPEERGTGSKNSAVVEELDEMDEWMEDSSDEERLKTTNNTTLTKAKDDVLGVTMEKAEDGRRLASIRTNVDSESSLNVKKPLGVQSVSAAFRALSSVMKSKKSSRRLLLKEAQQEIQALQSETARLKSLKICLNQRREAFISEICLRSGLSKQRVQRKLQRLSSIQRKVEEERRAANQLPAGDRASVLSDSTDDDIIITSSSLQQQSPQAPPTPAMPTASPVQAPVRQLLPVSKPVQAPSGVSHNASVVRNRPRTVPNILSRSKKQTVAPAASFQALVPAEVVPLVGAALPRQPVLTMSPLMGPTILQTSSPPGVASVALNISNLTSQQIHLTSLPHPHTATKLNNVLQLVQPSPTQQQQQQQRILQPKQQRILQPKQNEQAEQTAPPQQTLVSTGPGLSPQNKDQDQPESTSAPPPSTQGGSSSSLSPGQSADRQAAVTAGVSLEPQTSGYDDSLTSLLNEIVFLNQQTVTTATTEDEVLSPGKPSSTEQGHTLSPWLLELDSDSDDQTETTQKRSQSGPANTNVVAPPPLLQMKVGGANVGGDPTITDGATGRDDGGGRREADVAWRPMPRLVPLGMRGNPPC